jgi:propionyl-CoA carboxylase beta chain
MTIDPHLLDTLAAKRGDVHMAGGKDKYDERRKKGVMTARERIEGLFEPGTFTEMFTHAHHEGRHFGLAGKKMPGDGVITGIGMIGGRQVAAFSQDFTVGGGSLGRMHAKKINELQDYALKTGMPIVGINDSGGARIQEGVDSLEGYGNVFFRNVLASGIVPQVAIISGPCAGGAAYSPALMDFIIMVKKTANMFICGPEVIFAVTGEKTTMDDIGSAETHARVSGNIHFTAENDAHALAIYKKLLSFLPSNNVMDPPHHLTDRLDVTPDLGMNDIVPANPKDPFDVLHVIGRLVDGGEFMEVQRDWARNMVVGFARVQGVVVGIIANQPMVKAGCIDIDASDKAARFIRFCNTFNVPLVTLVDTPGFLPGIGQERGGIIRHGAKVLFSYAAATVPKITVFMRKAYGGAYIAMASSSLGADMTFAWPCAEIAVMGAEGASRILYRKEITSAPDPKAKEAELIADYRNKFCTPYESASKAHITDVIDPSETRAAVAKALRYTLTKRETRPPKKHGTIPL